MPDFTADCRPVDNSLRSTSEKYGLYTLDPTLSSVTLGCAVTEIKAVRLAGGPPLRYTVDAAQTTLRVERPNRARNVSDVTGSADAKKTLRIEIDYASNAVVASEGSHDVTDSLYAMPVLKGDPAASRTVVTVSEPDNAIRWLPSHDIPTDRAIFSIDM